MSKTNGNMLLTLLSMEGKKHNMVWICRESSTGRGIRLHQSRNFGERYGKGYNTAREALEAFLREKGRLADEE
jgi:hypothetical protein